MRALCRLLVLAALALPSVAAAHLLPEQRGTVNVVGQRVFTALSLPVSTFPGADENRDGLLSPTELARHNETIRAVVVAGLKVVDPNQTPSGSITWVVSPHGGSEALRPTAHVVALQATAFPASPRALRLEASILKGGPPVTLIATRGDLRESLVLDGSGSVDLLRGPGAILADAAVSGARHILGGWDHLAFLAALLLAGTGRRYLAVVITSFTLAHSLTLGLAAAGWVRIPPQIVEPAILASVVLMGFEALRRIERPLAVRAAMVFACGLLHGLGFASATAAPQLDLVRRIAGIAGFNLGIELGQAAFVSVALTVLWAARRSLRQLGIRPRGRHWRGPGDPAATPPR